MALRLLPEPGILGTIDETRSARLLEERTRALARRGAAEPARGAPVLLLAVGAERFGLPLDRVAEILPAAPACPLPGAPPAVLGLRARAGRILTVLDLAALLGFPGTGEGEHDILLRPLPGGRRLALRAGRALLAVEPVPLPAERAPAGPGGAVAFHALLPGSGEASAPLPGEVSAPLPGEASAPLPGEASAPLPGDTLAVLDLDRLLRSLAAFFPPAGA